MNRTHRIVLVVAAVVVLLVVVSAAALRSRAAPTAQAPVPGILPPQGNHAAATAPEELAGGPGFYMQSALNFRPWAQYMTWDYGGGGDLYNPGPEYGYYVGSVSLPDGVTVTNLVGYYYDISPGADLGVKLYRYDGHGTWEQLAAITSSGSSGYGTIADGSIDYPVIDQQNYSYSVWVYIEAGVGYDLAFTGVRIDYAHSAKLPLVLNDE